MFLCEGWVLERERIGKPSRFNEMRRAVVFSKIKTSLALEARIKNSGFEVEHVVVGMHWCTEGVKAHDGAVDRLADLY